MTELDNSLFKLFILASNDWNLLNPFIDEYIINHQVKNMYQFQYSDQSNYPDLEDLPEKFIDYIEEIYILGFNDGRAIGKKLK